MNTDEVIKEKILQQCARGSRDLGAMRARLYALGSVGTEIALKTSIMSQLGTDYFNGADVIRCIQNLIDANDVARAKKLVSKLKGSPWCKWSDFVEM